MDLRSNELMMYLAYEETKTLDLRLVELPNGKKLLQQKFIIRDGIGIDAKFTEEWRDVQVVPFNAV